MEHEEGVIAAQYERLKENREVYLTRARQCAKLTIPTLIPEENNGKHTEYPTPYQGIGARGVNTLASKLLLSLFPPNSPFFTMRVDDYTAEELGQEEGARAKVDEALGKYERAVMQSIEDSGDRSTHFESIKHLVVAGNVLLYLPKEGKTRAFPLSQYVVERDTFGTLLCTITHEKVAFAALEPELKELVRENPDAANGEVDPKAEVDLYTKFWLDGNRVRTKQEIAGTPVPGSEGHWDKDKSPILALRWTRVDGEDYGRSYVEEYLGDLISLEGLSKALLEGAAIASRVVFLVNSNARTRAKDLNEAENGGFVNGFADDVTTLQVDKQADMAVAKDQITVITERLSYAFMMNSAIQRNGERVTAEEVRFMAGELEDTLGGVYSILSQEYQLPYVKRVIDRLTRAKRLPSLPKGVASPTIITGLEALGRGHDLNKYDMFLKALAPLGPEVLQKYLNVGDYITRIGTSLGIDAGGLVRSEEQLMAEQEQAMAEQQRGQMMDVAGKAVPAVAKEAAAAMAAQQTQEG